VFGKGKNHSLELVGAELLVNDLPDNFIRGHGALQKSALKKELRGMGREKERKCVLVGKAGKMFYANYLERKKK
jgi:hypothetical protein